MNRYTILGLALGFTLLFVGCGLGQSGPESADSPAASADSGMRGMGMGSGMMARHMATIPEGYAGLTNPVAADEASLDRGAVIYSTNCATCHGDGGMGDGPAGEALDPPAVPIAHTGQMLGDDYLFWRISEGGTEAPFQSAMPGWKSSLTEEDRWDVINYVRALGQGEVMPGSQMGGTMMNPAAEATQQADMLDQAVEARIITEEEAALFARIHPLVEGSTTSGSMGQSMGMQGNMATVMGGLLEDLVAEGEITQEDADAFVDIHDRLVEAGLMR